MQKPERRATDLMRTAPCRNVMMSAVACQVASSLLHWLTSCTGYLAARAELQTSNVLRRKLEELCRGLQRENKEVAEAASRLSEDDKTVQQAMQAKLHSTLEVCCCWGGALLGRRSLMLHVCM